MRNLVTHALSPDVFDRPTLLTARGVGFSVERVLREVFWRSTGHPPLGTLSSLADARAKKILQSQR
jgi:hypothetical protein